MTLAEPWLHPADDVVAEMGSDTTTGLTSGEVDQRLLRYGPNELTAEEPVPWWRRILAQVRDPLVVLLLIAVVILMAAWFAEGRHEWPIDALVIAVIVVVNAVIGVVQERKAEDAVAALQRISAPTASVIRDGEQQRIPTREVVPGDLILLTEGDTVAADARLTAEANLTVAEAALTGESEPVAKSTEPLSGPTALGDRTCMVFGGTAVTRGTGRAVATATGMASETGEIARLLATTETDPTPLQREIALLGRTLGIAVLIIAAVVVTTALLISDIGGFADVVTAVLLGVSLAVAAVPEGLPAVLSVVLAIGVQRMAARNAIVKNLSSVETLGSASVICSDKTGTLTENQMTLVRVVTASGAVELDGAGYEPTGEVRSTGADFDDDAALRREVVAVLSGGSIANDAVLRWDDEDSWTVQGDPTEAAFLVAERKLGTHEDRARRFRRVAAVPFTSERKMMSTVEHDAERDGLVLMTKGAPDVLLERCTHVLVGASIEPLAADHRARVAGAVEEMTGDALRTLGVAFRGLPDARASDSFDEDAERDLVWCGVVGIIDPPRPEARDAVAAATRAGIRVIMITGDHPRTALRIATDLGIVPAGSSPATGLELDDLDEEGWRDVVRSTSVFARVSPEHKLRIVDALQADGHVVAMTGDGVNDAPALKSADIGVAMGITGTEVTRQAGAMILADDNFATIVAAVREGRGIFQNIKKFLRYMMSSNLGEVLAVFVGVLAAGALGLTGHGEAVVVPLLATQILWINLLTDTVPALAMGVDPQTEDVMARPPRGLTERVIDARMWRGVALIGTVMAGVTLGVIDLYLPGGFFDGGDDLATARTAGFTVLVLAQLFNAFNSRSEVTSAFRGGTNRWLWGAVGLAALLQVAVVHVPFLGVAFGTAPLRLDQWLVCVALASSVLWASELRKLVGRRLTGGRAQAGGGPASGVDSLPGREAAAIPS